MLSAIIAVINSIFYCYDIFEKICKVNINIKLICPREKKNC